MSKNIRVINMLVKYVVKIAFIVFSITLLLYLSFPSIDFPNAPEGAVVSSEPADTETPLRRAYFTNFTREEVMKHYREAYQLHPLLQKLSFLPLRLNYPPEEAQIIIRDQTRSTFLEEISFPLRESLYINGFEPKNPKDDIWYEGEHFRQKITVLLVPSSLLPRLVIGVLICVLTVILFTKYLQEGLKWLKRN